MAIKQGTRGTRTYVQDSEPPSAKEGDLWVDTDDDSSTTIQEIVDDAIVIAIADDDTVTEAAALAAEAAVDAEILGRPILEGGTIVESDPIFAVVDKDGRRTWIEAAPDGGLTDYTILKINEHMSGAADLDDADVNELSFAVVDEDGRRTWIESDLEGKPTPRSLELISEGIDISAAETVFPSDDWACWGDSLTEGTWPGLLATLIGHSVFNGGVGGQSTEQIMGRQGGVPPRLTLTGNAIPATTTAVTVTAITFSPLSNSMSLSGYVNGILGTLAQDGSGVRTFTRSVSGDAVTVSPSTPWVSYFGEQYRGRTMTIWVGRNGFYYDSHQSIVQRIQQMLDYQSATVRRVIVMSVPPSTLDSGPVTTSRTALNTLLSTSFPAYYLDISAWLQTPAAATAAGITFTADDLTDIANGFTPRSLRSDEVHFNTDGNEAIAYRVRLEAQNRGWI